MVATIGMLSVLSGCGMFDDHSTAPLPPKGQIPETRLRPGDSIQVRIDGVTPPVAPLEVTIDENGEISMPFIGKIKTAGLTIGELSRKIESAYVPNYYRNASVTVLPAQRFFYVGGEVRNPNRFLWTDDLTLTKAISAAGGFTEYASRGRVQVARGKTVIVVDAEEARRRPEKDIPILPGDSIQVPRGLF
jgi:protein involved in polysaccharide export with SLBB domain